MLKKDLKGILRLTYLRAKVYLVEQPIHTVDDNSTLLPPRLNLLNALDDARLNVFSDVTLVCGKSEFAVHGLSLQVIVFQDSL